MWPRLLKRPKVARNAFSAYLRGRMTGAGIGEGGEAELYADEALPLAIRVAFAIGLSSKRRAPILAAHQVERKVAELVDLAAMVAHLERDDDPEGGPSTPPAAQVPVVPVVAGVQSTSRTRMDPIPPVAVAPACT